MKVLVGMSGGVDSSVAAYVLKQQGHEVIGATMSIWDKNNPLMLKSKDACFSPHEEKDIEEAREVCRQLDIPYYVFDCTEQYKKIVLSNFKQEYLAGRTPNPCVWCNTFIKFDTLPMAARENGIVFDKFATGHYVRLVSNGRYRLQQAADIKKDQSYFLYRLKQEQLAKILFPLGEYPKEQVREMAKQAGLKVHTKQDSQDFYSGDINDILEMEPKVGNFVTLDGKILGQHQGIWNFTVGQRRGMGISSDRPLYVIDIDKEHNNVIVGYEEENARNAISVKNLSWLSLPAITETLGAKVKVRSAQNPVSAILIPIAADEVRVEFAEPQKAVAYGQSAVFYDDDDGFVLGGGIIEKAS